ncbi:esterase [Halalkalibacter wakoensis JCM 9140]|uniref:Esterase n=1 Tax=Halalkalibacter wakoensis JCM 9140 TaxID=1236970 RepID=W4Q568_9BACI|nr:alpha/beta hydrolase [Halalkalibacter wakoensis]GAE26484.1 esterase [Halalkalibacter wakoensis JCM 9140]
MKRETIIFLHGIVGNKNAFKREMESLQGRYQCIAYDLYDLEEGVIPSMNVFIEQLYQVFDQNNIELAHLCALSFGSVIAQAFAKKFPHLVASMTFVGGYLCNVRSSFNWKLKQLVQEKGYVQHAIWVKKYANWFNPNCRLIQEDSVSIFLKYALQVQPDVLEHSIRLQLEFDSKSALSGLRMPILWVMGEYDELYKSTLVELKKVLPHVQYEELKKAGHVAHIHEHEPFMLLFESFLTDVSASDRRWSGKVI